MLTVAYMNDSVADFHQRDIANVQSSAIWIPRLPEQPVLVLGSRQQFAIVDHDECERSSVGLARRRSGGGAVLVDADQLIWFDVVLTREHPGWSNDVVTSFFWLSERLVTALRTIGIDGTTYAGPMVNTEWSDLVCFAGLGPGEITVDGKKLVGISQRRTRNVARYQVAVLKRWRPEEILRLFALPTSSYERAMADLAHVATISEVGTADTFDALLTALEATAS